VLVYTRENLWQHGSTPVARDAIVAMCGTRGFAVTASSDPRVFAERLGVTDVVVFAVTSGEVLGEDARAAFEPWLRGGGGMVGIHSASATELSWPFFVEAVGAQFLSHAPGLFEATVRVEAAAHPIVTGTPPAWVRTDEWYVFTDRPEERAGLEVLLALDEESLPAAYPAEFNVGYHPIAWAHQRVGGRVFYTAMGHTVESYAEPAFLDLLARGILWAAPARGGVSP
jgi:type 1 glutamine amidotransferase